MKFKFKNFSCEVDVFKKDHDLVIRFYNKKLEHEEKDICDLVIVDPGYGYLCLKFKGEDGLLSGYLDENVFSNDDIVNAAIDFVEKLSPLSNAAYIPHHIDRIQKTSYIEYNGEY
ncbi:MAG: hypothetical protein GY714_16675 [Desulfobacterales bacterium]|nr:hypothetical protein [Desulfobacterales bacterium]MCP4163058.1 hypothetical protein [Deltaproteobacteria bacterium]